jgi:pimeloyl-ACP methyl ester carboxylesterase
MQSGTTKTMSSPEHFPYRSAEAKARYLALYDQMEKDWPSGSETRMVPTSFGQTFVRINGPETAPPLVLVPGVTSTSLFWAPMVGGLSKQYRVYALDWVGDIGRSTCTRRMRNQEEMITWLNEFMAGLHLGNEINLMGLSYGGWLTARFAMRFPKRLRKAVLVAPAGIVMPTSLHFLLRSIVLLTRNRKLAKWVLNWTIEDTARLNPARVDVSVDRLLRTVSCIAPRRIVRPTVATDQELAGLQVPTLFMVGEHEKIYSAARALARLRRAAPQIRTELIPNAGHDLTIIQPELVTRKILEFLAA